jgi:hypothetical protein
MKEEVRPVVIDGCEVPGYFVSNLGKVYCAKFSKVLPGKSTGFTIIVDESRMYEMKYKTKNGEHQSVMLSIPDDILTEYNYRRRRNGGLRTIDRYVHQLVMYAFRPIDDYPPISKEDWDLCPESAKRWIKETYLINHIDHNPRNNRIDNLEYVTPRENSRKSVKFYNGNNSNKNKIVPKKEIKQKLITLMDFV